MLDQSSNHVSLSLASNEDEKVPEVEEDYKNEFDIPEAKHSKKSSSKFYLQISSHACLSFMKSYKDSIILMCRWQYWITKDSCTGRNTRKSTGFIWW